MIHYSDSALSVISDYRINFDYDESHADDIHVAVDYLYELLIFLYGNLDF